MKREEYNKKGLLFRFFNKWDEYRHYPCAESRESAWILTILSAVCLAVALITMLVFHTVAPGEIAEVEQVRQDLHTLDICDTVTRDRLIGLNTQVRSKQRYNDIFPLSLYIPDAWDELEIIKLPAKDCYKQTMQGDYNLNVTGLDGLIPEED